MKAFTAQMAKLPQQLQVVEASHSQSDENKKYMKMTKDDTLEGSSQQANKYLINRRNGQGPKHLKFFLLVFSKDEAQAQEGQAQEAQSPTHEEQGQGFRR